MQGIVVENVSNLYKIQSNKKIYTATSRGKLKQEGVTPLVGDTVEFEELQNGEAVINKVMQRKSETKRPRVANISQMILVISTKDPKPDLFMLDKQLAYLEFLKITPVIVINKIDLSDNYKEIKKLYENVGYTVISTNAKEGKGVDDLIQALKNNISALSGNSGVGKSTLINAIFKKDVTQEGEVSKKNKKGKNTTTNVKLYELAENSFIVDTPGFASFDIYEIESKNLDKYFIEFSSYIQNCEFTGCTHIKEENCGIKEALKQGKISDERYNNFCTIYNDLKQKEEIKW